MLKVRMVAEVSLLSGKQEAAGQDGKIDKLKLSFEQHSNLDIKSQSTWDYLIKTPAPRFNQIRFLLGSHCFVVKKNPSIHFKNLPCFFYK